MYGPTENTEQQLLAHQPDTDDVIPIGRSDGPLRPSYQQQQLWFLDALQPGGYHYNMTRAFRLVDPLDIGALKQAFAQVALRHDVLRSRFLSIGGDARLVIQPPSEFQLPQVDLRGTPAANLDAEVRHLSMVEAEQPFDLETDEMLRGRLICTADRERVLLVSIHHIASDGSSMRILLNELSICYECFQQGRRPSLPPLEIQYADYAEWQRNRVQHGTFAQHLSYWRQTLDGAPVELPILTDFTRPDHARHTGARRTLQLSPEISAQIKALARSNNVSRFITLLAAFKALLARYSGQEDQEDIVVGSPFANRNHRQTEDLIGLFANVVALRTDLSGDPTFSQLLSRVADVVEGAKTHQELPLAKLVEALQPPRSPGRMPWVQVCCVQLFTSAHTITLPGLSSQTLPIDNGTSRFDFELNVLENSQGLELILVFDTDLFHASTAERMLGHYQVVLNEILRNPDQRSSRLPLLSESERHQLLTQWNHTGVDYPRDKCVHELFEQQVEQTPDAAAVVFEDQQLTYRELNERANQLAHHLRQCGVGAETLVGLCLERSLDLVVGILGILKAGGAYVPLDADCPPQRLQFMLQHASVRFLVTQQALLDQLPAIACHVCLDTDAPTLATLGRANPQSDVQSHNLAYLMYTSGSTGRPKGVAMLHAALVNLINWHRQDPRLSRPARTLQFASNSFDVSFQEMLTTWCCGGTLVMISEPSRRDPKALWSVIVESRVERLFVPFVALQVLATSANQSTTQLRDIVSAGELLQLTPEIRRLLQKLDGCRLHNHYGPTESHVVTSLLLSDDPDAWPGAAPIGRPIFNTQVYVLDAQQHPAPIGSPGELYIGGDSLARGYVNDPELMAERVLPNPFSDDSDARLYRTGDLCRWRADGNLEFLGRIDDQVKLRGFRIELGEIESVLNEHPSVAQSVVALREDRAGDERLVGYFVPSGNGELNVAELSRYLQTKLPEYMVPSGFVALDALPLTPSGKVNRRALPTPDESRPELAAAFVAPRYPSEERLATIWREVLNDRARVVATTGAEPNSAPLTGIA